MPELGPQTRAIVYEVVKVQLAAILDGQNAVPQAGSKDARGFQQLMFEIRVHILRLKQHLDIHPPKKKCPEHVDHAPLLRLYEEFVGMYNRVLPLMQAKGHKTDALALPAPSSS